MGRNLKLYVWEESTDGYRVPVAFALASDPMQARSLIRDRLNGGPHTSIDRELEKAPQVWEEAVAFTIFDKL